MSPSNPYQYTTGFVKIKPRFFRFGLFPAQSHLVGIFPSHSSCSLCSLVAHKSPERCAPGALRLYPPSNSYQYTMDFVKFKSRFFRFNLPRLSHIGCLRTGLNGFERVGRTKNVRRANGLNGLNHFFLFLRICERGVVPPNIMKNIYIKGESFKLVQPVQPVGIPHISRSPNPFGGVQTRSKWFTVHGQFENKRLLLWPFLTARGV